MTDTRWLTAEQLSAWKKLIAVVELLPGTLESQLQRDSGLSHFEYFTLAMLSEAPDRTLRMTTPRRAHQRHPRTPLPRRLAAGEARAGAPGGVRRGPPGDQRGPHRRRLDARSWPPRPGTSAPSGETVIDPLTAADVADLDRIMGRILEVLDPSHVMVGAPTTDD